MRVYKRTSTSRFYTVDFELDGEEVNRYIATLRKAIRYACHTLHLIDKAPVIKQFPADEDVERQVTYVFTSGDYQSWISGAEEPLRSCSILARYCGICRGEMLVLEK